MLMLVATAPDPEPRPTGDGAAAGPCACTGAEEVERPICCGLSNDYLNHYSEALMLIELSAADPEMASELAEWRPLDYRSYFGASPLRRAEAALRAYDALPDARRLAFEALVETMNGLATTAIIALRPPCEPDKAMLVAEATLPAFRRLVARAAAFLNSGGDATGLEGEVVEAQGAIDRLMERTASTD